MDFDGSSMPVAPHQQDVMRNGLCSYKSQAQPDHPVETIQKTHNKNGEDMKLFTAAKVYGKGLPIRLQMEQAILGQFNRLPGLSTSHFGAEIMNGAHEDIDFEDYLADPATSEKHLDVHLQMERRIGLEPKVQNLRKV